VPLSAGAVLTSINILVGLPNAHPPNCPFAHCDISRTLRNHNVCPNDRRVGALPSEQLAASRLGDGARSGHLWIGVIGMSVGLAVEEIFRQEGAGASFSIPYLGAARISLSRCTSLGGGISIVSAGSLTSAANGSNCAGEVICNILGVCCVGCPP
jgi:hypothetical protein